ncbi:MAG: right-handed parallel beta-helix repeat-containing protein [Rikenellaceae bacterium]
MKLTKTLLLFALLVSVNLAGAKTFYVAQQSGSDRNVGSVTEPFKTISKASTKAIAGDSIVISSGVYREWVSPQYPGINPLSRITYMAKEGEDVWIKGSEQITSWKKVSKDVWRAEVSNVIFGDYNPFDTSMFGDWLTKGHHLHLGEVYLNNKALAEMPHVDSVKVKKLSWIADVYDDKTIITANFADKNPNKELSEINVRKACFFPKSAGMNYITVKGIKIAQAATPWAPPTAQQWGAIGPNWSLGWIIEDCEVSNSKCVGISLGKGRESGENMWELYEPRDGYGKYGFTREVESVLAGVDYGWTKELVGSHLVQNNKIFDCGQAGVVGHMGCAFSTIRGNEIFDINTIKGLAGHEISGIKLHAAIDVVLEDNIIVNTWRGMWLDWQAQGTKVVGNIFDKNTAEDLFIEVSHGPTLVYNNVMLSDLSMMVNAQGIAYFNNLIRGSIKIWTSNDRYTPYHYPHSTKVRGLYNNNGGDVKLYNNILLGCGKETGNTKNGFAVFDKYPEDDPRLGDNMKGVAPYMEFLFPIWTSGNVYFGENSKPYKNEKNYTMYRETAPEVKLERRDGKYYLTHNLNFEQLKKVNTIGVNTRMLGQTIMSELIFDNADGTEFIFTDDLFGRERNIDKPTAGPFESAFDAPIWQPQTLKN